MTVPHRLYILTDRTQVEYWCTVPDIFTVPYCTIYTYTYRFSCLVTNTFVYHEQHLVYFSIYFYNTLALGTRSFSMVYCTVSIHNLQCATSLLYCTVPCLHLYIYTQYITIWIHSLQWYTNRIVHLCSALGTK